MGGILVFQLPSIRPLTATDTITLFQLYYWGTWFTNFKVNLFSGPQKQVTIDRPGSIRLSITITILTICKRA